MANNINRIFDEYSGEDYLCYRLKPIPGGDYVCTLCGQNCDKLICDDYCVDCQKDMEE